MIPKIIHYCWFGHGKKPRLVCKCIRSWKKYCPDYQIIEWNEDNYDFTAAPPFVLQAMEAKMWAFASDYVRLSVVYEHGGIYLDTDVELVKSLDSLLDNKAYFGFEKRDRLRIATGLGFGAEKGVPILREIMDTYEEKEFIRDGRMDLTYNTIKETEVLMKHGVNMDGSEQLLDQYIHIYPIEYFNPSIISYGAPVQKTQNTVSIHWYSSSWWTEDKKKRQKKARRKRLVRYYLHNVVFPRQLVIKLLGQENFDRIKKRLKPNT